MSSKTDSKKKKKELPYLPIFLGTAVVVIGGAVAAALLLTGKDEDNKAGGGGGGGGGDGGGFVPPTDPPEVTVPPGSIIVNKTCYSAPNTEQLAEGCKELPVKGFPFQYIRRTCTEGSTSELTSETCSFSDCDPISGGLRTNTDGAQYQDVPAPQRVTCNTGAFPDACYCSAGCADACNDLSTPRRLCLRPGTNVQYGAAKGTDEMDCPFLFCYRWSNDQQDWVGLTREECSKVCIPELYLNFQNLGDNITVEEQLDTLGGLRYNYSLA